tara:strand:+ start:2026 stop:2256 length:231 start_codon:yes stop_codon:yes gene_type:complete
MNLLVKIEMQFRDFIKAWGDGPTGIQINEKTMDMLIYEINMKVTGYSYKKEEQLYYRGIPVYINNELPNELFYLTR